MNASISGFKIQGDWEEVVKHGERITRALRESGVLNEQAPDDVDGDAAFEEWDEWRPKSHEGLDSDMNEKTAEQASVSEAEKTPEDAEAEDLPEPEAIVREASEEGDEGLGEVVGALAKGLGSVAEAAESASRQAMQKAEEAVYKNVMTQLGPYYFDNALVSANLHRTEDGDVELFVFEVNVNDDELKDEVAERLAAYEETNGDEIEPDVEAEEDPDDADLEDLDLPASDDGDAPGADADGASAEGS